MRIILDVYLLTIVDAFDAYYTNAILDPSSFHPLTNTEIILFLYPFQFVNIIIKSIDEYGNHLFPASVSICKDHHQKARTPHV